MKSISSDWTRWVAVVIGVVVYAAWVAFAVWMYARGGISTPFKPW